MFQLKRRFLRAMFRSCVAISALTILPVANAVVVRGRLTDPLGKPVVGGKVQLVQNGKVSGIAFAGPDGYYEIRSSDSGRFRLLGFGAGYMPAVGTDFYGGLNDVLDMDVIVSATSVHQEISVTATGIPTPLPQLTTPVSVLSGDDFADRLGVVDEMRLTPGAFLVQTGQTGGVTSLFLRGGNSSANLVLIDGIPAGDVGGVFDYGTVSSTAVGRMELYRGPDSAMYGTDAGAGVITIETPKGAGRIPTFNYTGDAGTLHTWRNEASLGGDWQRLDYYGAFSRMDTSNAVAFDRYHSTTSAINLGYDFNGNTQLRFTIRNADSVEGAPGAYDFSHYAASNRQGDQDLYTGATLENRTKGGWHNLARYGIARKREQFNEYQNVGNYIASAFGYYGDPVTIKGANGYKVTGQVALYNGINYDQDSNRDQVYYQSDKSFSEHFNALFGFRYDDERGSYNEYAPAYSYTEHEKIQRTNFEYNLQLQGEFFGRLFYSAGGAIEKNHLYGIAGTPKLGLTYQAVRPGRGYFHGTRLRANVATGVQEPSLTYEYSSLYRDLLAANDTADIAKYHVGKESPQRSRTYDIGLDQNIIGDKLVLKFGYFHNTFDRQIEQVSGAALAEYFGLNPNPTPGSPNYTYTELLETFSAYVNSLAFRAQGVETELQWQATAHLFVKGGYTYLATNVVQSFESDAIAASSGAANVNPNFPNLPIGIYGPLIGARAFRRAPNTGYFDVLYSRKKLSLAMKGALSGKSDDSDFLDSYSDLAFDNSMLLPNRDLDYGYAKIDLRATYQFSQHLNVFAQLDNLLNDQHIGPIGYPGLPFTARAGVKIRIGGE